MTTPLDNAQLIDHLSTTVLAIGALGTAAFGIVDASKWLRIIGEAGFGVITSMLGTLNQTLAVAYGGDYERLLRGQYRGDQAELAKLLRQGVRVGLTTGNATAVAAFLGNLDGAALSAAIDVANRNGDLATGQRAIIGRYEVAADARISAALAYAQAEYVGAVRVLASIVAVAIAMIVGYYIPVSLLASAVVGIAAVPLAPIAKDLASGIQAASKALKAKS